MLTAGPRIRGVDPVQCFVCRTTQSDAATVSSYIGGSGDCAKLDIFVVNYDCCAFNRCAGAVDRKVASDNDVIAEGDWASVQSGASLNEVGSGDLFGLGCRNIRNSQNVGGYNVRFRYGCQLTDLEIGHSKASVCTV